MHVKICGITRLEDAQLASELGAYAVGFVFWPASPRFIEPARARAIAEALPERVVKVGVFVNQSIDEVKAVSREATLGAVQLHGDESVEFALGLALPVIKAVPVSGGFSTSTLESLPDSMTVLLDAHDPVRRGGTGQAIDWTLAAAAAARRPVILSGGLHAANIRAAIAQVSPFAVDVSSGVEAAPGVKDHAKLRAFFSVIPHA